MRTSSLHPPGAVAEAEDMKVPGLNAGMASVIAAQALMGGAAAGAAQVSAAGASGDSGTQTGAAVAVLAKSLDAERRIVDLFA
jgi:hypothetical protein